MKINKSAELKLREHARAVITSIVEDISQIYGYKYNRIAIRNQRTRLGSCSSHNNLNFNWQIIKFPEEIRDYVIKHELSHLVHHNHSHDFWGEVAKLDPEYKSHHKWLKTHAHRYLEF